jgi:hypothetical protein
LVPEKVSAKYKISVITGYPKLEFIICAIREFRKLSVTLRVSSGVEVEQVLKTTQYSILSHV